MFSAPIFDSSNSLYVTFAGDMGDQVFGMSAQKLREKQASMEEHEFEEFLDNLTFRKINILIRA